MMRVRLGLCQRLACTLGTAALLLCGFNGSAVAQTPLHVHGEVHDATGRAVKGAAVVASGARGEVTAVSAEDGRFDLNYPSPASGLTLRASGNAMESDAVRLTPAQLSDAQAAGSAAAGSGAAGFAASNQIELVLHPSAVSQQITVTATRSSLDVTANANTAYGIGREELNDYPAYALDDKLRQQAGFELYRRSSSRVQNPTSQGISLRGLGSTAASRTLVLQDGVPMNDPFGGWIHWDEIPAEALEAVTIATGGGSDLYGSSALGGVIDVLPARPTVGRFDLSAEGGGQDTSVVGGRADLGGARLRQLVAGDFFRTAGYIPTAPGALGPVDRPANVHDQTARSETDRSFGSMGRVFLVGNLLNEARGNGTLLQNNATRLWRYIGGDDWGSGAKASGRVRLFGSDEGYRQSFSSINAPRTTETLTRLQRVRTQEIGASTDASFSLKPLAIVVGSDVRDIRATDNETPIASGAPSGVADTSARQRFFGGFAEALAAHGAWSAALSLRLDGVWNLDTRAITQPSSLPQPVLTPNRGEFVASPRFGLVRQLGANGSIHASVFRAFRSPTMNELYRTGQVGQETTQANAQLLSERATGWEIGARYATPRERVALAGTYFWTEINRPVSAVLVSSTATSILEKRENLGQILSQGTELHLEIEPRRAVSATLGYQYAHAVVTRFSAQPSLVGNWIPEVPRESVTAQIRARRARIGEMTLALRASGHAFDDSANTYAYILRSFVGVDLSARHDFGRRWTASLTVQNMFNQRPDVARTPILTLGSGLLAQGGVEFYWDRAPGH
jgi:outer membrane receptor protein involved in Fe transport